jgi:hypothetical protein
MLHRSALVLILISLLGFLCLWFIKRTPSIALKPIITAPADEKVADDQFLILLEKGQEAELNAILKKYDLELLAPIGEWFQVKRRNSLSPMVDINSQEAKSDLSLQEELENDLRINKVHFNYELFDMLSCADELRDSHQSDDPPNDRYYRSQWYLSKENGIDMPGAWHITTGSKKTVIAVVDRNFDAKEFDLAPTNCQSRKFQYEVHDHAQRSNTIERGHGADVLSVLAPCTNNDAGLAAVDWHAQVLAIDSQDDTSLAARMFGILWAIGSDPCTLGKDHCPIDSPSQTHAKVINTSFGFANKELKNPPYGVVLDTIGQVNRHGSIVVASAGNEGGLADRRLPGASGGVISVGSSNQAHMGSTFSNWGRTIDVLAPGEGILGLMGNELTSLNGTSFSAPLVSGVVALMASLMPELSWKHAEYILKKTATPLTCGDYCGINSNCRKYCCENEKNFCSSGIINAKKALELAKKGVPDVALIDIDDYYVPLRPFEKQVITVKNWGKKPALVRLKKAYEHLKIDPKTIIVPPMDQKPGSVELLLSYNQKPKSRLVISLVLEAADEGSSVFHDQIEAIVEIIPDHNRGSLRILKELEGLF